MDDHHQQREHLILRLNYITSHLSSSSSFLVPIAIALFYPFPSTLPLCIEIHGLICILFYYIQFRMEI